MRNEVVSLLKEDIQKKTGKKLIYQRDFVELSKDIFEKTNAQISLSTLKRFFGKVDSPFQPSRYTIDTLVTYLGFEDWDAYINGFSESKSRSSDGDTWNALKLQFHLVTEHNLAILKQKSEYDQETFALRNFVGERLNAFQISSKTATILIAPEGSGKSGALVQIIEDYLWTDRESYRNDLVCLIDGGTFFNLLSRNPRVELLNQLLDFNWNSSLYRFFNNHPEQIEGRIWLLIDDVDEVFSYRIRYHYFVENLLHIIQAHCNSNWMKMIFTCRPENLDVFSGFIHKNPTLADCWYEVNFPNNNMTESINVPLLNEEEIEQVLLKSHFGNTFQHLKNNHSEMVEIIQHPHLLSLFIRGSHLSQEITDYHLLSTYITKKVFQQPYRDEKLQNIDRFFELCDMGRETNSVKKELLPDMGLNMGYRELLSMGIIYEYTVPEGLFDQAIYVKFKQNAIFEFLLMNKWVRNTPLNIEVMHRIIEFYKNNEQLRCKLYQLGAKILLHQKAYDTIIKLHEEWERYLPPSLASSSQLLLPSCLAALVEVIKRWLRINPEFKNHFWPWVSNSTVGQVIYGSDEG